MQDGIDYTSHESSFDEQQQKVNKNPDANDLCDDNLISIENETLGGFDDDYSVNEIKNQDNVDSSDVHQSNDNHEHSNHQHVIINGKQYWIPKSNQHVGATQAHRIFTAINGGYNIIGGTVDDFKILMRDLNCFIGGTDGSSKNISLMRVCVQSSRGLPTILICLMVRNPNQADDVRSNRREEEEDDESQCINE
uniref:Uncharacterized protein n=1 Tax=Lactuca sativa TaxID=4236 RepID=A0A9R1WCZ4_LACSA|nr:hypothetical protein LSAT_V11C200074120 [Lactuca sativa]